MKTLIALLGLLPLAAKAALFAASYTTVTATVSDSDGQAWTNGTWKAELVLPGGTFSGTTITAGGVPVPSPQKGLLDASGLMTARLVDTGTMDQSGVQWKITVCPNASIPPYGMTDCATFTTAVTGTTLNLTSKFSFVAAPRFPAGAQAFGYSDIEAIPGVAGVGYFNTNADKTIAGLRIWDGQRWVAGGGGGGGTGNVNPSPQYRITYYNQPGTQSSVLGDAGATTDANGGFTVTSLIGKFISSLGMAKQWRSSGSATDGCQNLYGAGYTTCYIEPGYTTDAGMNPSGANPTVHVMDRSYPGDADVYLNTVGVGSVGTQYYGKRTLYSFDNRTPAPHANAYDTRPIGESNYLVFPTRGRSDNGGNTTQWSVGHAFSNQMQVWGAGIHEMHTDNQACYSIGDCSVRYSYLTYEGGSSEGSAEGVTGVGLHVTQDTFDEVGTIGAGATSGATTVKLNATNGTGNTVGVGRYLVDTKAAVYTGNVTASSGDAYGLNVIATDATFTPSTWIGRATGTAAKVPINIDNPPDSMFTLTTAWGDPSTLAVGDHVCFASQSSSSGEELPIDTLSISGSTVTLGVPTRRGSGGALTVAKNVNAAGQNIGCGAFDALASRLVSSTGMMNPTMAVAYPDSHTVLTGWWSQGALQGANGLAVNSNFACTGTFRQSGTTVTATLTAASSGNVFDCAGRLQNNASMIVAGTTDFNGVPATTPYTVGALEDNPVVMTWTVGTSATIAAEAGTLSTTNTSSVFNVWPMAIVFNVCDNAVTTAPTFNNMTPCLNGNVNLETNSVSWASGDAFEVPHYQAIRVAAERDLLIGYTPSTVTVGKTISVGGEAYGGRPILDLIVNDNNYFGTGGRYLPPPYGMSLRGPNLYTISTGAPSVAGAGQAGAVINVGCAYISFTSINCATTAEYYFARLASATGTSGIKFRPATGDVTLSAPVTGAGVLIDRAPIGFYSAALTTLTVAQQKQRTGGMFFDTTSNHFYGWDSGVTGHQLAWKDDVPGTATSLAGGATGQLPVQTAANVTGFLGTGSAGQILTSSGSGNLPVWSTNFAGNAATASTASVAGSLAVTGQVVSFISGTNPLSAGMFPVVLANGSNVTFTTLGGDLSGAMPNPIVSKVNGGTVPKSASFLGTDASGHLVSVGLPGTLCYNTSVCPGYQAALGFAPVQQGGGAGQSTNKVYIGWSGSNLKAQVDSSDLGSFCFAASVCSGYQPLLGYTPLNPANNLGDLGNAATARSNLGLGSLATQNSLTTAQVNAVGTISNSTSGNALTATEFQGTPSNCAAGEYFLGIDRFGNANGCASVAAAVNTVTYINQNSSGTMSFGTTYTNSTSGRIRVYWTGVDVGGSHSVSLHCAVGSLGVVATTSGGATTSGDKFTVQCDVPVGGTYVVTTDSGGGKTALDVGDVFYELF